MGAWFGGWIEAERGRFILWLPVAMGSAILVYFGLTIEPPLWLGGVFCAATGMLLATSWRWPAARFFAALLLVAAIGFTRAEWRTAILPPLLQVPYGTVMVSGRLAAIDLLPTGRRVTISLPTMDHGPPAPRNLRIRLRNDDAAALEIGDAVALRAMLFRQDRPAYPGGWDFGRDAFFQNLGASGFALGGITVTQPAQPGALAEGLQRLRAKIAANIMAALPVDTGSVAVTLLTGFQQIMPAAERQAFIAAGLAHLLAVAGLHVGIVMGLFFGLARYALARSEALILRLNGKAAAAVVALTAGAGYAALTGAHLPILRSLAMASLVTAGVLVGRRAISLRGLALAALLLMLLTPEAVIGVSFQMSFSAVLALIAGYAAARDGFALLHRQHGLAMRLLAGLAALSFTSLLAGGASMPFAAYQFQEIQPYWIVANLVAVPLTAFWIMPSGLLALALMPFGLAHFALLPMGWGISIILWMTQEISQWPAAMLRIKPVPTPAILLFAFGLAWLGIWRSRSRLLGLIFIAAALPLCLAATPPDVLVSADARLIAIRQGESVLLFKQKKAAAYTAAQWQDVWGDMKMTAFGPDQPAADASCDPNGCVFAEPGGQLVIAFAVPPSEICAGVMLVVSPEPLRGACRSPVIDRFTVWRDGAVAAWLGPNGIRMESDRDVQGARPWVPPWPKPFKLQPKID